MIRRVSLRNFIYYSTLLGVFSAVFVVRIPFAFRLFDAIMLLNLPLMFLLVDFALLPVWILCFILYLALSGTVGILFGTDTLPLVAKEFLGISVSLLYFYYFFKMIGMDYWRAFQTYLKIAYWFAILAFPLWIGSCVAAHGFERLKGLTQEPEWFCTLVLPAYYWSAYMYLTERKEGLKVAVFTLAIALSGSSMGYLCVAFGALLLGARRGGLFVVLPLVASAVLGLAYVSLDNVRTRVDDTFLALSNQDVSGTNLSTYALISNLFVTEKVLHESPLLGNGLGSHPVSHERFFADIPGVQFFVESGLADYNAPDASSMTLRVLSELGLVGFFGMLVFLIHFHVGGKGPDAAISNALLVCFFLKLVRFGLYFPPELLLFVFIYMLNHRASKRLVSQGRLRPSPNISPNGGTAQGQVGQGAEWAAS
jgi:hypothetical protein